MTVRAMDAVWTDWFDLDNEVAYRHWREHRLEQAAARLDELLVEVRDPRQLSAAEHEALLSRCRRNNMALYASRIGDDPDKEIPRRLGEQLGLQRLDHNWLADDDGITSLTVNPAGEHPQYIPYTNRPIHWHTDGYYNPPARRIHGLLLHCVHPAARGGENALMDPVLAYIHLRDADPAYVAALMRPDAMTIPEGTGEGGGRRPESVGPVFSVTPETGALHMRYTARRRNIRWAEDVQVQAAARALADLLASDRPGVFRGRLESGMGLVSNNVLHDRAGFEDDGAAPPRLLYRARFYDRIAGA